MNGTAVHNPTVDPNLSIESDPLYRQIVNPKLSVEFDPEFKRMQRGLSLNDDPLYRALSSMITPEVAKHIRNHVQYKPLPPLLTMPTPSLRDMAIEANRVTYKPVTSVDDWQTEMDRQLAGVVAS